MIASPSITTPETRKRRLPLPTGRPVPTAPRHRRVSFAPLPPSLRNNHESHTPLDRTQSLPPNNDKDDEEELWISHQAIVESVRGHARLLQQLQLTDSSAVQHYCELLAQLYAHSILHADHSHCLGTIQRLGRSHLLTDLRGVETLCLASVASDRLQRRRRHQATLRQAQDICTKSDMPLEQKETLLRLLSEQLSASSRIWAQTMGMVDAVAAINEHATALAKDPVPSSRAVMKRPLELAHALPAAKRRRQPCKIVSPVA